MYLTTSPLFAPAVRRRPALDATFDRALTALARSYGDVGHRVEGSWSDGTYQLTVDLPGTPEEAVGVSVAGRTLTITVAGEGDSTWFRDASASSSADRSSLQFASRFCIVEAQASIHAASSPAALVGSADWPPLESQRSVEDGEPRETLQR